MENGAHKLGGACVVGGTTDIIFTCTSRIDGPWEIRDEILFHTLQVDAAT